MKHLDENTVYTFCMCPGGYVVAAASEEGGVVTNGMSYADRDGENANAALLVTVNPADFPYEGVLGGMPATNCSRIQPILGLLTPVFSLPSENAPAPPSPN